MSCCGNYFHCSEINQRCIFFSRLENTYEVLDVFPQARRSLPASKLLHFMQITTHTVKFSMNGLLCGTSSKLLKVVSGLYNEGSSWFHWVQSTFVRFLAPSYLCGRAPPIERGVGSIPVLAFRTAFNQNRHLARNLLFQLFFCTFQPLIPHFYGVRTCIEYCSSLSWWISNLLFWYICVTGCDNMQDQIFIKFMNIACKHC